MGHYHDCKLDVELEQWRYLTVPHEACHFPLQRQIWPCLVLIRNLCYLRRCVYHGPHFCVLVGAGDQGKNAWGNCVFIPLKIQGRVKCHQTKHREQGTRPPHVRSSHGIGTLNPRIPQQPCSHVLFGCTILCVYVHCTIWLYSRRQVYLCVRYNGIVAEDTGPLHTGCGEKFCLLHWTALSEIHSK